MSERFADLIFDIPVKNTNESVKVAVLIELKSHKEKFLSFQLLEYLALAYRKQSKRNQKLQLIIPVVYYHGKTNWIPLRTIDLIKDFPSDLSKFIPLFDYIFIDLKTKTTEELAEINNNLLKTAVQIQFLQFLEEIETSGLIDILIGLEDEYHGNYIRKILVYIFRYFDIRKDYNNIISEKPEPFKLNAMTIYDRILAEGKAEGEALGREKEKIEMVLNAYAKGIAIPLIANISGLTDEEVTRIIENKE